MATRAESQAIREAIGRYRFDEGWSVPEIVDGLERDLLGIGYKVKRGRRQVENYVQQAREERIRQAAQNPDAQISEVAALETRIVDRLRREIERCEAKRRLSAEDIRNLNTAHKALIDIDKRARKFAKRPAGQKRSAEEPQTEADPIAELAQRLAERPPKPVPKPKAVQQETETERATERAEQGDSSLDERSAFERRSSQQAEQVGTEQGPTLPEARAIQARRQALAQAR